MQSEAGHCVTCPAQLFDQDATDREVSLLGVSDNRPAPPGRAKAPHLSFLDQSQCPLGDVIGDLNARRGRILGMEARGKQQVIRAQVPLAEMLTYQSTLNSLTGARGAYTMEP
ncbi:MAG: hypothetical protein K6U88_13900 [Dehalococcoidia bacterium]|nr:hypothetical protein [Dehalococcoidia bacterium]